MIREFRIDKIIVHFYCILLFVAYPYVFNRFLPIPNFKLIYLASFILLLGYYTSLRKITAFPPLFWWICFIQMIGWVFFYLYHNDGSYLTRIFYIALTIGFLQLIEIKVGVKEFITRYNKWVMIMAIGGVSTFILVFFFNLGPIIEYTNIDSRPAYCFGLTCTNTYFGNIIRFGGFFDEPGAMANWGVYALILNKLFVKNKRLEWVLIFCLLFTFSLAYFIQLGFYLILFNVRNLKTFFVFSFFFICVGIILLNHIDENSEIYEMTVARFEYDSSSGTIKGNSRSELTEKAKAQFITSPLMGVGAEALGKIEYMDDNPYEVLAKDGVIGTFIVYLPLLIIVYKYRKNKEKFSGILILALGYLQRPFHVDLIHPTMLYSLFILTLLHSKSVNKTNNLPVL